MIEWTRKNGLISQNHPSETLNDLFVRIITYEFKVSCYKSVHVLLLRIDFQNLKQRQSNRLVREMAKRHQR